MAVASGSRAGRLGHDASEFRTSTFPMLSARCVKFLIRTLTRRHRVGSHNGKYANISRIESHTQKLESTGTCIPAPVALCPIGHRRAARGRDSVDDSARSTGALETATGGFNGAQVKTLESACWRAGSETRALRSAGPGTAGYCRCGRPPGRSTTSLGAPADPRARDTAAGGPALLGRKVCRIGRASRR